jgi:hypothetical protein
MGPLLLTIEDITAFFSERSWGALAAMGVAGLIALFFMANRMSADRSRRFRVEQSEELQADREADLLRQGPPRFNG